MTHAESHARIAAVRASLEAGGLSAFLVPHADEFQLEYPPAWSERLAWLTGFTGSAGAAVVTRDRAALFVDGRYTVQVREQADASVWEYHHLVEDPPEKWLGGTVAAGDVVGFDPRLHTPAALAPIRAAVERAGATLQAVRTNPIDGLWVDRPALPATSAELWPVEFAGQTAAEKRARIVAELVAQKLDAVVLTAPEVVAWAFNLRGRDVDTTPIVLSYGLVRADGRATVFVEPAQVAAIADQLDATILPPSALADALGELGGLRVRVDQGSATVWVIDALTAAGATVDVGPDPCALPRACKNDRELEGMRAAHVRDGVALVRFMKWFADTAPGDLDEESVQAAAERFRARGDRFRGLSFHTISAFGPNGAKVHYSVTPGQGAKLRDGSIYLLDSGVQYLDGTTDVTRSLAVGTPTPEMRRRYTQVLQGHVALSRARFPEGTTGSQLDAFARQFLWADGVDYDHGTGHGVGCFLAVHEGPQNISKRPSTVGLRPGMIVSNEPGYYKEGHFGLRIENLLEVVVLDPQPEGAERKLLGFLPLTLAPYDRRLIEATLLSDAERAWVDAYHRQVADTLTPLVEPDVAAWLAEATAPLVG